MTDPTPTPRRRSLLVSEYGESAASTDIYSEAIDNLIDDITDPEADPERVAEIKELLRIAYTLLGLTGELGEVCNKFKKNIRKSQGATPEYVLSVKDELGDISWYVAETIRQHRLPLEGILVSNLNKLEERASNDTLEGEGDHR